MNALWVNVPRVIDTLNVFLSEYEGILREAPMEKLPDRVWRWRDRVSRYLRESVSAEEAEKFERIDLSFSNLLSGGLDSMLNRPRVALTVLRDELVRDPESIVGSSGVAAGTAQTNDVFLSHAAADRPVAEYLREEIIRRRPGSAKVFLASRPGHIRSGDEWWAIIQTRLRHSGAYVILLTPTSVERGWILFETGAAWMTGRPLLTVSAGGLRPNEVRWPLAAFQINSLEEPEEATAVMLQLGADSDDVRGFCERIGELARTAGERAVSSAGWSGVSVDNRYFAWDGPTLHQLEDRTEAPMPSGLTQALEDVGMHPSFARRNNLTRTLERGAMQVFETDRKGWRKGLVGSGPEMVLVARPTEG